MIERTFEVRSISAAEHIPTAGFGDPISVDVPVAIAEGEMAVRLAIDAELARYISVEILAPATASRRMHGRIPGAFFQVRNFSPTHPDHNGGWLGDIYGPNELRLRIFNVSNAPVWFRAIVTFLVQRDARSLERPEGDQ